MKKKLVYAAAVGIFSSIALMGCSSSETASTTAATAAQTTAGGTSAAASSEADTTAAEDLSEVQPASEITFWSTKEDCFSELCAEFEAETGIKVNATYMGGYDDMVNKVMAGIAGENLPNVAQLGQRHGLAQMYDSGWLLPVEDYISEDILEDILPGFWKRFTYKDTKVILPFQNSMPMLYYNKTLFDENGIEIPTTLDEVAATAKEIKDKTGIYGVTLNSDYPWYFMALMYNSGTAPLVDGQPSMNTEAVKNICQKIQQLAVTDQTMPANQHATAQEDFCNGNIGMLMTSCASYATIQNLVGDKFEVGIAMFPEVTTMDITIGGNGLGMFKSTPEEEKAATMFIEFMLDPQRIAEGSLNSGYVAVTNAATETETYQTYLEDPNRQVVDEQLQYLGGAAVTPVDSLVWNEVMDLIDSLEADPEINIDERLAEIDTAIADYMSEYAGNE